MRRVDEMRRRRLVVEVVVLVLSDVCARDSVGGLLRCNSDGSWAD